MRNVAKATKEHSHAPTHHSQPSLPLPAKKMATCQYMSGNLIQREHVDGNLKSCRVFASHSGHHVQMLLRAAEVLGQVIHAEVLMLTGINPEPVLLRARDSIQKDPKCFPDGFLTN